MTESDQVDLGMVEAWANALRSGRYKQGRGQLAGQPLDDGEMQYCCLGVACEVAIANGVRLEVENAVDDGHPGIISRLYNGRVDFLPNGLAARFGLQSDTGILPGVEDGRSLSQYNDDGASFDRIADLIEAYVLGKDQGTDDGP